MRAANTRVAALALAAVASGCNPPPAAGPPPAANPAVAAAKPAEIAEAPPARPECPPGTSWEGDQCVQAETWPQKPAPTAEPSAAEASPPPPGSFQMENGALKLPGPVLFATGKATLDPASEPVLTFVKSYLTAKPEITLLRVEVHTSNEGSAAFNQKLTEQRSLSAARWLVAHGVDCKRLIPVGFGASKPVVPNNTPEGRAKNRRVLFVNATLKGRAIGGLPVDGGGSVGGDPCASP